MSSYKLLVLHRIDDLEKQRVNLLRQNPVLHRIDDLETDAQDPNAPDVVLHRIDDLEIMML